MNKSLTTLKELTRVLLSPELDYSAVRNACVSLAELFTSLSGFDAEKKETQQSINGPAGHAISPASAALCIMDMMRTRNFLQGINQAIEDRLKETPGRPVMILYAGTGPFATLLTPLITVFSPGQIQLVLLEINNVSLRYLQRMVEELGMEPYIAAITETDAATYNIPEQLQPDIIVSETMKPGLEKEPQVSIVSHLFSQCNRNPVLVPAMIRVDLLMTGEMLNNPGAKSCVDTLFELDATTAIRINNEPGTVPVMNDGIRVMISDRPDPVYSQLVLGTTIQVYKNHTIGFNESGITIPKNLVNISSLEKFPATLLFQYRTGADPGFRFTIIEGGK